IRALARAHVLISGSRWLGADLRRLVNEDLAPYCTHNAEKIIIAGPDVVLEAATAQVLAGALHELSTNAAKYRAISLKSGRVALVNPLSGKSDHPSLKPISIAGNRVLLVEDETVVAIMMSDTLAEQGISVVGPFAGTREAIAAAGDKDLHGAVLDVNLNGELI